MKTLALIFLLISTVALSGCGEPKTLDDFIQLDMDGTPIQCDALINANQADNQDHGTGGDDDVRPTVMWAAEHNYTFKQCGKEIHDDKVLSCLRYGYSLRASLSHHRSRGPWLQYDHLPSNLTTTCGEEIRATLKGVNEAYKILPGKVISLDDQGVRFKTEGISNIEIDSRDASVGVWRITLGQYFLWFTDAAAANRAYDALTAVIGTDDPQGKPVPHPESKAISTAA